MYKRYAAVLITDEDENILLGMRRDSGKLANPGGKIEEGEEPYCGAIRELQEETGLDAKGIELVKVCFVKHKKLLVYLFKVKIDKDQAIDTSKDPDKEFLQLGYFNPSDVVDQLHVPLEDNVLIKYWAEN